VGIRNRRPVYGEIGHTIMNLLADFHNFQYMVPQINGLVIRLEDKKATIKIPCIRYDAVGLPEILLSVNLPGLTNSCIAWYTEMSVIVVVESAHICNPKVEGSLCCRL